MQYFKLTIPTSSKAIAFVEAEFKRKVIDSAEYHTIVHMTGISPAITQTTYEQYAKWVKESGSEITPIKIGLQ